MVDLLRSDRTYTFIVAIDLIAVASPIQDLSITIGHKDMC